MVKDPMTGVYSRATLGQRLHEEIDRARRYEIPLSIIMLDLDHFKSVNDAFGHLRGDQVLISFAQRLRNAIRKSDLIYRYGGDEFLLLLPNTSKVQGSALAQRLLEAIHEEPFEGDPPITLTLSLGVASFPDDGHTPETLFEKADQRHYSAKRHGRDRAVDVDPLHEAPLFFDPDAAHGGARRSHVRHAALPGLPAGPGAGDIDRHRPSGLGSLALPGRSG